MKPRIDFRTTVAIAVLIVFAALPITLWGALTKANVVLHNATTLTAGAADTNSATVNATTFYATQVDIKITNGATGPTVPGQSQIQVAADGAGTLFVNFGGPLVANTGNSVVTSWSIELPLGIAAFRTVSGSNTGQNVTLDVDYSKVTAL